MLLRFLSLIAFIAVVVSCSYEKSSVTGWSYNDKKNGDFQKMPYVEQETGPNLVLVEGGTFTMGRVIDDVMSDWNSIPRRVTVSSYYMDETEISNFHWLEYLYWMKRIYYYDYPDVYYRALPDTLVWRRRLAYNEPYVDYYLRHPSYRDYPVVGVSWKQATDFCSWRTDRVNEQILVREGLYNHNPNQVSDDNFNTEAYLYGLYEGDKRKDGIPWDGPNSPGYRDVKMEDGILLPKYRLPTEAEWEYAAYGLVGNTLGENIVERRMWPWNGHAVRNPEPKYMGEMLANFKRGRGDNMGVAGKLNDNGDITTPVYQYWPNDYGLYNMAGNVSEWVLDVYRPLTFEDAQDFRPYRGNVFKKVLKDEDGIVADRDSLGRMQYVPIEQKDALNRRNYRRAYNINYRDGDYETQINEAAWEEGYEIQGGNPESFGMYEFGATSLVNDKARVYKGGSWADRAYWMSPGTRRFLDENASTDFIGFRCAMDRLGSPQGLGKK
jgi:sulfatase modifying factor 1